MSAQDENGRMLAEVGTIEVMRHSKGPCRHCGYEFEQKDGRYGCGCSGMTMCPSCGARVKEPLNAQPLSPIQKEKP